MFTNFLEAKIEHVLFVFMSVKKEKKNSAFIQFGLSSKILDFDKKNAKHCTYLNYTDTRKCGYIRDVLTYTTA